MQRSYRARMEALEAALPPLARAERLVERGVPPERWPDEELNAYCDQFPEMQALSSEELERLIAMPEDEANVELQRMLAAHR